MNIDELAKLNEQAYPGYLLSDWYEAAFPSYELHLRVQLLSDEPLSPAQQYVLHMVCAGLTTPANVAGVLGLDDQALDRELESLEKAGCVTIQGRAGDRDGVSLLVTTKGRRVAEELAIQVPREDGFSVCLDAVTGRFCPYQRLMSGKSVRDAEYHQIPFRHGVPSEMDIDLVPLQNLWREHRHTLGQEYWRSELLDVIDIHRFSPGYRVMRVLQFIRENDGELRIHVYDHRDPSPDHASALLQMESDGMRALRAERLPAGTAESMPDPALHFLKQEEVEAAKERAMRLPALEQEIDVLERQRQETQEQVQAAATDKSREKLLRKIEETERELERRKEQLEQVIAQAPTTTVLTMPEHRPKLLQALREAEKRVIIISPWLKLAAVDRTLVEAIHKALHRGIEIWIGFGFGVPDAEEEEIMTRLNRLKQDQGRGELQIIRLKGSHAKVIVCDDRYMITTSFNWLSFAGRSDWGNRIEFGLFTTDRVAVSQMLDVLSELLEDGSSQTRLGKPAARLRRGSVAQPTRGKQAATSIDAKITSIRKELVLTLDKSIAMDLVYIPEGECLIGSEGNDDPKSKREKPKHKVRLSEYWIGKFPVTNEQFALYVDQVGSCAGVIMEMVRKAKHPVRGLIWNHAVGFCEWLTSRITEGHISPLNTLLSDRTVSFQVHLPSEAEWEKAARGMDGRLYPWGNRFDPKALNHKSRDTTPVGQFSPQGDSPFGCADMAGNVWEWTSSLFWSYPYRPDDGREDPFSPGTRVLRGGSYHNTRNHFRCANRVYTQPTKGDDDFGFRIVLSWFPLSDETS